MRGLISMRAKAEKVKSAENAIRKNDFFIEKTISYHLWMEKKKKSLERSCIVFAVQYNS